MMSSQAMSFCSVVWARVYYGLDGDRHPIRILACSAKLAPIGAYCLPVTRQLLLLPARGTSEWTAQQISEAWAVADRLGLIGPAMEQPQYHMLERQKVPDPHSHCSSLHVHCPFSIIVFTCQLVKVELVSTRPPLCSPGFQGYHQRANKKKALLC